MTEVFIAMKIKSWLLSDDSLKITLISNRRARKLMPEDQCMMQAREMIQ